MYHIADPGWHGGGRGGRGACRSSRCAACTVPVSSHAPRASSHACHVPRASSQAPLVCTQCSRRHRQRLAVQSPPTTILTPVQTGGHIRARSLYAAPGVHKQLHTPGAPAVAREWANTTQDSPGPHRLDTAAVPSCVRTGRPAAPCCTSTSACITSAHRATAHASRQPTTAGKGPRGATQCILHCSHRARLLQAQTTRVLQPWPSTSYNHQPNGPHTDLFPAAQGGTAQGAKQHDLRPSRYYKTRTLRSRTSKVHVTP